MFWAYVIKNDLNKIYIGQTSNLGKRLLRHNAKFPAKKTAYTYKNLAHWKIIYKEMYNTRQEAIKREKELKSSRGRAFIRKLFN